MRIRLMVVVALAIAVIVSSCGDDDTDTAADADVDVGEPSGGEASGEDSPTEESSSPAGSPGTGTMTVGDLTYELDVIRCVTLVGAIAADAVAVAEPDNVSVSVSLSPEDWQDRPASEGWTSNGSLRLDVDEPYQQWEAGIEALAGYNLPGPATLEDFTISSYDVSDDGRGAQGEASFASINALLLGEPVEPIPGTFAITCPNE